MRRMIVCASLFFAGSVLAADWDSCQDDLNRLRRRASNASDAAESVKSQAEELKEKREELEQCRSFPRVYDLFRDGCRSLRSDYESARSSYEAAKSDLESHLDDVATAIRSVELSCSYSFRGARIAPAGDSFCRLLQGYKRTLSASNLLQI